MGHLNCMPEVLTEIEKERQETDFIYCVYCVYTVCACLWVGVVGFEG